MWIRPERRGLVVVIIEEAPTLPAAVARRRRDVDVAPLVGARRSAAKAAFTTRRVPPEVMQTVISGAVRPRTGDLVLASVQRIGHHTKLELASGRRATLHLGDEIIVAYGDRYAPDQFESQVPTSLHRADLVASGGIASAVISKHRRVRQATKLQPIGLIGTEYGLPINLADHALQLNRGPHERQPTIAVVGTSMNSGKTTIARHLIHSLVRGGYRAGATKVTGTGSGNDYWMMVDAGAERVVDFTDAGFASTYRIPMYQIEHAYSTLLGDLHGAGCNAIVMEVADGIYQDETAELIASSLFASTVDAIVFAAGDAMGAAHGVERLRELGLPVSAASGVLTSSPLALREAERACGIPILSLDQLRDPGVADAVLNGSAIPTAQPVGDWDDDRDRDAAADIAGERFTTIPISADAS